MIKSNFLRIWLYLPEKSFMENFIFCAVYVHFVIKVFILNATMNIRSILIEALRRETPVVIQIQ